MPEMTALQSQGGTQDILANGAISQTAPLLAELNSDVDEASAID